MCKERSFWLDNLKGFLILLVVLGHSIQFTALKATDFILYNYIHSFHVPLFMLASGYAVGLSSRKGVSLIKKRLLQLMIPYFIWSFIWFSFLHPTNIQGILLHPELYLWFCWVLFFISVLSVVCKFISDRSGLNEELITYILSFILIGIVYFVKIRIFAVNLLAIHFFFYQLGVSMYKRHKVWKNVKLPVIVVAGIISLFLSCTFIFGDTPFWVPLKVYIVWMFFVAIFSVFFYIPLFSRYNKTVFMLTTIGRVYTLPIYLIHLTIIKIMDSYLLNINFVGVSYCIFVFILWLSLIVVSVELTKLLSINKYISKVLLGV